MRLRRARRKSKTRTQKGKGQQPTGEGPFYQYYAQVTYNTCEHCLRRHGEIFSDLLQAPPIHPGCRCSYLEIEPEELDYYREKMERMQAKAEAELQRRMLFRQARMALRRDEPDQALELFQRAAAIEVYVEEIEQLCAEDGKLLTGDPGLAAELKKTFVHGYRDTLQKGKYEHMPEGMKWARERWGVQRIKELFDGLSAG